MLPATVFSEGIHLWRCFYLTGEWPLWGDVPFPEWCLKRLPASLGVLSADFLLADGSISLWGKEKHLFCVPFLCSEYGLHLLSVRRTNGVKDMEKASVYTGWNISPDLSDQRDRQGQFIWLRQLYLYSLLFFQLLKAILPVYLQPPYEWSAHSVCTSMLLHVCEG